MSADRPPFTVSDVRRMADRCLAEPRGLRIHSSDASLYRKAFVALTEKIEREQPFEQAEAKPRSAFTKLRRDITPGA